MKAGEFAKYAEEMDKEAAFKGPAAVKKLQELRALRAGSRNLLENADTGTKHVVGGMAVKANQQRTINALNKIYGKARVNRKVKRIKI